MSRLRPASCLVLALAACNGAADPGETQATEDATTHGTSTNATTGPTSDGTGDDTPTTGVTTDSAGEALRPNWHEDIAPLVAMHCRTCHTEGGIAPFGMETYEQTAPWAPAMAQGVELGLMPPWHAQETEECAPPLGFKHDARLSAEQQALFTAWAANKAPEGDPKLAAPIPTPPSQALGSPSVTTKMGSELTITGGSKTLDFFHCISIDPGNTETVYIDGLQVIAGNPEVVHHVLIYVDQTAASKDWTGGVSKDCGGGAGVNAPVQLIGGWVPGSLPIEPPADVGTALPAGSRLIMNVHYHAAATTQKDSGTGLAIRWKPSQPGWTSIFELVGAPGSGTSLDSPFLIPANAEDHVEEYVWPVSYQGQQIPDSVEVRVWATLNHMHKVGVDMRVWVEDRDTGVNTCLLHTPVWDYNWQRSYAFDAPVEGLFRVKGGDKIHVKCRYNNSTTNPGVNEMLQEVGLDAPFDVKLGEGTLDEMCVNGLGVAIKGGI